MLEGLEKEAREGRIRIVDSSAAGAAVGVAKDSKETIARSDAAEGDILITPRSALRRASRSSRLVLSLFR